MSAKRKCMMGGALVAVALAWACGQAQVEVDGGQHLAEDAHHAAQGIIDDEVWEMIDSMVADTPHGEMTLEDLGGGMTEATVSSVSVNQLEEIIADSDLLRTADMLDGDVSISITFDDQGGATLTILQQL